MLPSLRPHHHDHARVGVITGNQVQSIAALLRIWLLYSIPGAELANLPAKRKRGELWQKNRREAALHTGAGESPSSWRREAVFYQIYMPFFEDSDGDGCSDFAGMTSRLDYLHDLSIKGIWLTLLLQSSKWISAWKRT